MIPVYAVVTWSCGLTTVVIFDGETAEEAFEYLWFRNGYSDAETVTMFWRH